MTVAGVALLGATGRMGRSLLDCLPEFPALTLVGALGKPNEATAKPPDLGTIVLTHDPVEAVAGARVAVDFTLPDAVPANLRACAEAGVPAVVGVTGLDAAGERALDQAAEKVAVFYSANMSTGVALLVELVRLAGRLAPEGWDAGILDLHHRAKRDAPSGTALTLERAFREGGAACAPGHADLRLGDVVGEHTLWLAGEGERLELAHRATDRRIFARGALRAAAWILDRSPGRYGMRDLLGASVDTIPEAPVN